MGLGTDIFAILAGLGGGVGGALLKKQESEREALQKLAQIQMAQKLEESSPKTQAETAYLKAKTAHIGDENMPATLKIMQLQSQAMANKKLKESFGEIADLSGKIERGFGGQLFGPNFIQASKSQLPSQEELLSTLPGLRAQAFEDLLTEKAEPKRNLQRAIVDDLSKLASLRDDLNTLMQNYPKVSTGPIVGRGQTALGFVGQSSKEFEQLKSDAAHFKDYVLNKLSGAALTVQEANRIAAEIPDENDPPERFMAKFNTAVSSLNRAIETRIDLSEDSGFDVEKIRSRLVENRSPTPEEAALELRQRGAQ